MAHRIIPTRDQTHAACSRNTESQPWTAWEVSRILSHFTRWSIQQTLGRVLLLGVGGGEPGKESHVGP